MKTHLLRLLLAVLLTGCCMPSSRLPPGRDLCADTIEAGQKSASEYRTLANVLLLSGLAVAATGAATVVADNAPPGPSTAATGIGVGLLGGGVILTGTSIPLQFSAASREHMAGEAWAAKRLDPETASRRCHCAVAHFHGESCSTSP